MKKQLNKNLIERFSRQIVLKDIGILGQKKILSSKVLIIGAGGLGCPSAEFLTRAGVGKIGIVDYDKVNLSNLHRQSLYKKKDVGKFKVLTIQDGQLGFDEFSSVGDIVIPDLTKEQEKTVSKYDTPDFSDIGIGQQMLTP